jgi:phosphatidate cytidylyltransferase
MHMGAVNADSENSTKRKVSKDTSLRSRLIVIDVMVPSLVIFSFLGGWPFSIFVTVVLCMGAWEFWRIFQKGGYSPSLPVLIIFIVGAVILRTLSGFQHVDLWLAALLLTSMFFHILKQQKGDPKAASGFAITACGAVYLGWLGSYAISVRNLEHGLLWVLLVFPIISLADSGGYIFGRLFGKHKMLPIVSPKKSWEGYLGGILMGGLGGWGLASLWHIASSAILPMHGLILGIAISILAPLGDFGESMIKRQFCIKDSSQILPGHGGILDRADSSLWAAAIGYYLILLIR